MILGQRRVGETTHRGLYRWVYHDERRERSEMSDWSECGEWRLDNLWTDTTLTYVYHGDSTLYVYRVATPIHVREFGLSTTSSRTLDVSYDHGSHTTHIAEIGGQLCLIASANCGGVKVFRDESTEDVPLTRLEYCEMVTSADGMCYAVNLDGDSQIIPGFNRLRVSRRTDMSTIIRSALWVHSAVYASISSANSTTIWMRDHRVAEPEMVCDSGSDIVGRDSIRGNLIYLTDHGRVSGFDLRNHSEWHVIDHTDDIVACIG